MPLKRLNTPIINLIISNLKKAETSVLESFIFNTDCAQAQQAISHANAISSGIKAARDIANMPPNICNPAYLAEQAKNLAENSTALSLKVVDEEEMAKLGMNAYLAVSKALKTVLICLF